MEELNHLTVGVALRAEQRLSCLIVDHHCGVLMALVQQKLIHTDESALMPRLHVLCNLPNSFLVQMLDSRAVVVQFPGALSGSLSDGEEVFDLLGERACDVVSLFPERNPVSESFVAVLTLPPLVGDFNVNY